MRREEHWIAALAVAQFGLAVAVVGLALTRGNGPAAPLAALLPALPVPAACLLGGVLLVGAALGVVAVDAAWRWAGTERGRARDAAGTASADAYRLTQEDELQQLAATPGGDPFRELLRPMGHVEAVKGAAFSTREGLTLSARLAGSHDAEELSALAPALLSAAPEWLPADRGAEAEQEVTIRRGTRSLVVMARGPVVLSAMVDETAGENGGARRWLEATAAAGARLWSARYAISDQRSAKASQRPGDQQPG